MYARSTTIRGMPAAIDDGIAYLRDEAMPAIQQMDGCIGMSMLVERDTGRCIATSAWRDEEAMRASAERIRPMRERLVQTFGGEPEVQEWEIAVLHREHPLGDGGSARVTWSRLDPAQMDRLADGFRMVLLPRFEDMPGFCSASLMMDRESGRAVGTVSFESRDAMERAREQMRSIRGEFARSMEAEILEVAEMDVAMAHLRVPETV
ncbi:Antibiotic biosynthesis monooxygenase [Geodermatophilus africanus]|uniref:Antibiotic biosynthesis monooxygenase n=2 Tax=Geodermatophilus africanus TaxID=1137993 RepID=A0A1H3CSE5_9ACTN|nr:Antibiotic biosynthesis monooxygenase [Geodermatophilus africanus]